MENITGKEITSKLITQAKKRKNIKIYERKRQFFEYSRTRERKT